VKPTPDPANTTPVKLPIGKTGPEDSTGLADLFFDTLKKN
jgi:hypothetical protein